MLSHDAEGHHVSHIAAPQNTSRSFSLIKRFSAHDTPPHELPGPIAHLNLPRLKVVEPGQMPFQQELFDAEDQAFLGRAEAQASPCFPAGLPVLKYPLPIIGPDTKIIGQVGHDDLARAAHSRGSHLPGRVGGVRSFVAVPS